jgi:hypothetical protein
LIEEQKIAPRSVVFTLRPVDEPGKRFAYRLAERDAERFLDILWSSLEEKSRHQKPKRVERIPIPPGYEDPFGSDPPVIAGEPSADRTLAGFASPHEAWDAYRHARHDGRWRYAYQCLTPESQDRFVEVIVHMGACLEGTDDKDTARKLKTILKSHALDVDRIYEETKALPQEEYVKELNRRVEDREGLFHEAMTLMARVIPQPKGNDGTPVIACGAVTDVEISGDKATGRFIRKLDDRAVSEADGARQTERRDQVRFRKINGRWFCTMDGAY